MIHVLAQGGPVRCTSKIEDAGGTGDILIGQARASSRRRDWRPLCWQQEIEGGEEAKVTRNFCPLSDRPPLGGEGAGQRRGD